ncbi:MAG: NAD-dependent DNA ligase, partial [Corynebacterium urealyticum]
MEDKLYVFNYTQNRNKIFANLISIIDGQLNNCRC